MEIAVAVSANGCHPEPAAQAPSKGWPWGNVGAWLRTIAAWPGRHCVFLAVLLLLAGRYALQLPLLQNEADVLPLARQALNPQWLPEDWYLNQPPGYRAAFDYMVGWLVTLLPIETGVVWGRLLSLALFALAVQGLCRSLELGCRWVVLALLGFLLVFHESLVAGEWMVSGLEAKPFAYAFCLLALVALLRRQYPRAFCFLGLSVTFHVLVGLYATLCAVATLLCHRHRLAVSPRRLLLSAALFVTASAPGWWVVLQHLSEPGGALARSATRIYVHFRVPWHLLPSYWLTHDQAIGWKLASGAACVAVLTFVAWGHPNERQRLVATFALASLGLFAVGLVWAALGADDMLTYYWFRFPDTIVPFLACILLADLLSGALRRWRYGWLPAGAVGLACVAALTQAGFSLASQSVERLECGGPVLDLEPARVDVQRWIRRHTPPRAVFFVDPFWNEFYLLAERARFASFKHFPQTRAAILEWYHRLAGRDADPLTQTPTFDPKEGFRQHFQQLSATEIRALAGEYGLTHAVVETATDPFRHERARAAEVYRNERYVVYKLGLGAEQEPSPEGG